MRYHESTKELVRVIKNSCENLDELREVRDMLTNLIRNIKNNRVRRR